MSFWVGRLQPIPPNDLWNWSDLKGKTESGENRGWKETEVELICMGTFVFRAKSPLNSKRIAFLPVKFLRSFHSSI